MKIKDSFLLFVSAQVRRNWLQSKGLRNQTGESELKSDFEWILFDKENVTFKRICYFKNNILCGVAWLMTTAATWQIFLFLFFIFQGLQSKK